MSKEEETITIRKVRRNDQDRISYICHQTFFGGPNFPDQELVALRWALYYVLYEPEHCFVACDESDKPVGYILSSINTLKYRDNYKQIILPLIKDRLKELKSAHPQEYAAYRRSFLPLRSDYGPRYMRKIAEEYPAHLHIDIISDYQGMGLGNGLMDALLAHLNSLQCRGVHLVVGSDNHRAIAFYKKIGFGVLQSRGPRESGATIMGKVLQK